MSDSITPQASRTKLRLTEIFYSLQGESRTTGIPTVFIRLTGCPLRCQYCDTSYAFTGGEWWEFPAILNELEKYATHYVTVTGGEPLAQKACYNFLSVLCDKGYDVSLETSGAMDVSAVDTRVVKVMDLKTPASGELDKNLYENRFMRSPGLCVGGGTAPKISIGRALRGFVLTQSWPAWLARPGRMGVDGSITGACPDTAT